MKLPKSKRGGEASEAGFLKIGEAGGAILIILLAVGFFVGLYNLFNKTDKGTTESFNNLVTRIKQVNDDGTLQEHTASVPFSLKSGFFLFGFGNNVDTIQHDIALGPPKYTMKRPTDCPPGACLCVCDQKECTEGKVKYHSCANIGGFSAIVAINNGGKNAMFNNIGKDYPGFTPKDYLTIAGKEGGLFGTLWGSRPLYFRIVGQAIYFDSESTRLDALAP